ncbi:MAG: glycosyltransferase family 2 protein [Bacteroidia bacterium]
MNPLVSIVIPAYNAAPWIAETIRSVKQQTYQNWELLIINDGSTDDTVSVVESFLTDSRISLINQKNSGVSHTRNAGIEKARGQYIALLDADDWWMHENLEKKVRLLNRPEIDFVFSDMKRFYQETQTFSAHEMGSDENMFDHLLLWDREVIPTIPSNILVKKHCFESGLLFDPQFSTAADQDFAFALAHQFRGKRIPEALIVYRILPQSMSRNIARLESDHLAVYHKAAKNGLFKSGAFRRRCFGNLYVILAGNWWVQGNNKKRSLSFMLRAICTHPLVLVNLVPKIFRRNHS